MPSGKNVNIREIWGIFGAPNGLKTSQGHEGSEYVLSLKLDNGKVVSIAHEQTDRHTDGRIEHPVLH